MLTRPLGRIVAVALALLFAVVVWFCLQVVPLGGSGRLEVVVVHQGDSIATIAARMHAKGIIASPLAFRIDALIFGAPTIQPGSYPMRQGSSFAAVKSILASAVLHVEPGLTLREVAGTIADDEGSAYATAFLKAASKAVVTNPYRPNGSLEGLIGSGQYLIAPGESASQLLDAMTTSFNQQAASAGLTPSTTLNGLDAYQLLIAASIDEKEGYYPRYMPDVARVIYNRLAQGIFLRMDSTVLYYFQQDGGTVTPTMLEAVTPYNTYRNGGLTPTPICTVSKYSLDAVLHPPPGPWLYFTVVNRDGETRFSATFQEQLKNEQLAAENGI